jgi:hypothetical protein
MLKENWLQCIKNGIKNNLKEVGKGWFNLAEKRREVYDISKLKKFMGIPHHTETCLLLHFIPRASKDQIW